MKLAHCLFLVSSVFFTAFAFADSTDDLMEHSGINEQLESMPAQINAGLQQNSALPADTQKQLETVMQDSFSPGSMKDAIHDYLETNLPEKSTHDALAWLNSPLGQKITDLENASNTPAAHAEIQKMMPVLLNDSQRFSLIRKLDAAIHASESTVELLLGIQEAMLRGMIASAPKEKQISDNEIQQVMTNLKPQIKAQYELLVVSTMAYTYRSLSDAEIHRYIDFASSDSGKQYHQAIMGGFSTAMRNASSHVGKALGKMAPATADKKG